MRDRKCDERFGSLMKAFDALLDTMRKASKTLNDQDQAYEHMSASVETLTSLKKAVMSAYDSAR
jgi:DNA anti-recombination protein RmuC